MHPKIEIFGANIGGFNHLAEYKDVGTALSCTKERLEVDLDVYEMYQVTVDG